MDQVKALVTVATGEVVQLLITGGELPEVGAYYNLEHAVTGTGAQNRVFHSLTMEYFKSGMSSYDAPDYKTFKDQIKRNLGQGFDGFVYADMSNKNKAYIQDAKTIEDIPDRIKDDPEFKGMIRGKLKSWSCYTKKQRKECIDNVITEMIQCGINTSKFEEIMKGLNNG